MSPQASSQDSKSIFFSYSGKDEAIVRRVYEAVQRLGGSPYIDLLDLDMRAAIPKQLAAAIAGCESFVMFLSRNSLASGWVIDLELSLAIAREKDENRDLLVLVNLEDLDRKKDFPEMVRDRPSIALSGDTPEAIETAAKAIIHATTPRPLPKASLTRRAEPVPEQRPTPGSPDPRQKIEAMVRFMRTAEVELEMIAKKVSVTLGADAGILIEWHDNPGWKLASSFGLDSPHRLDMDEVLTEFGSPSELLDGRPSHRRFTEESAAPYRSALWAPLKRHGLLFGVVGVFLTRDSAQPEFSTYDREILVALAGIIADRLYAGRPWHDACVIHDPQEQEREFKRILNVSDVRRQFQPIISGWTGQLAGHAALIGGPDDSSLHSALELMEQARRLKQVDDLAEVSLAATFDTLTKRNKRLSPNLLLFLRIPPGLLKPNSLLRDILTRGRDWLRPWCTVLELQEIKGDQRTLRNRASDLTRAGFSLGVADSRCIMQNPSRVSELSPQWVRVPTPSSREDWRRLEQSLKSIKPSGARVIADGIRSADDVRRCWDMGIGFFRGDALAEPSSDPLPSWSPADDEIARAVASLSVS